MKVIFPFAGHVPCLAPCTHQTLEPPLECESRPILTHLLNGLCELPVSEFIFVVGYRDGGLRAYMDANYREMPVSFVEQREDKGLGYTVSLASNYVSREPVLIVNADAMLDMDWLAFSQSKHSTIAVRRVIDERPYGLVELRDGVVGCLLQKPRRIDLMLAGCYFIRESRMLFECLHALIEAGRQRGEYQLTDALQQMIELGVEMQIQEVELVEQGWDPSKSDNFFSTEFGSLKGALA